MTVLRYTARLVKPSSLFRRFVRALFSLASGWVSLAVLSGCALSAPPPATNSAQEITATPVKFVGRVQVLPNGHARYAWSGSGFVAKFRGNAAFVRFDDDKNEHQVVVDGAIVGKVVTQRGKERYPLVTGLPAGEHRIEVYRRTEALFGPTRFLGLEIEGGEIVSEPKKPTRRIEVIGDSISCGYGNLGTRADCPFSAETENHYESYGSRLARTFGAELSTVAWSGRGVVKNYNGEPGETMGALYERILPEEPSSRFEPSASYDLVIVNLGTNDFSTEPDPEEGVFVRAYVALLEKARKNSPSAYIVCTVGPMLGGADFEKAERAIAIAADMRKNTGDLRVIAYRMKTTNENPGCDWHPSVTTHQRMADELAVPIRTALGW